MPSPLDCPAPLTREQVRRVDRLAAERAGIAGRTLMERAGTGAAALLRDYAGPPRSGERIVLLCGRGNNGGDGFVIARLLHQAGYEVRVILLAPPDELAGDAAAAFADLVREPVHILTRSAEDAERIAEDMVGSVWIVDALLGTGTTGTPRPLYAAAIRAINAAATAGVRVLAVDLPSGLDANTGRPVTDPAGLPGPCVRADLTATFVAEKTGFGAPCAREFTGDVTVIDLGIPPEILAEAREEPV